MTSMLVDSESGYVHAICRPSRSPGYTDAMVFCMIEPPEHPVPRV